MRIRKVFESDYKYTKGDIEEMILDIIEDGSFELENIEFKYISSSGGLYSLTPKIGYSPCYVINLETECNSTDIDKTKKVFDSFYRVVKRINSMVGKTMVNFDSNGNSQIILFDPKVLSIEDYNYDLVDFQKLIKDEIQRSSSSFIKLTDIENTKDGVILNFRNRISYSVLKNFMDKLNKIRVTTDQNGFGYYPRRYNFDMERIKNGLVLKFINKIQGE